MHIVFKDKRIMSAQDGVPDYEAITKLQAEDASVTLFELDRSMEHVLMTYVKPVMVEREVYALREQNGFGEILDKRCEEIMHFIFGNLGTLALAYESEWVNNNLHWEKGNQFVDWNKLFLQMLSMATEEEIIASYKDWLATINGWLNMLINDSYQQKELDAGKSIEQIKYERRLNMPFCINYDEIIETPNSYLNIYILKGYEGIPALNMEGVTINAAAIEDGWPVALPVPEEYKGKVWLHKDSFITGVVCDLLYTVTDPSSGEFETNAIPFHVWVQDPVVPLKVEQAIGEVTTQETIKITNIMARPENMESLINSFSQINDVLGLDSDTSDALGNFNFDLDLVITTGHDDTGRMASGTEYGIISPYIVVERLAASNIVLVAKNGTVIENDKLASLVLAIDVNGYIPIYKLQLINPEETYAQFTDVNEDTEEVGQDSVDELAKDWEHLEEYAPGEIDLDQYDLSNAVKEELKHMSQENVKAWLEAHARGEVLPLSDGMS